MKIIFLDFDGVLNSATSFLYESDRRTRRKEPGVGGSVSETLSFHCAAAFQEVLRTYPDVKVVLSTTWRELFPMDWLKAKLESYHIDSSRVIDKTPVDRLGGDRGREIQWWLDAHPEVDHYVIIDDNDWGITNAHGDGRFIKTEWEHGMHVGHAFEMIQKLSSKYAKQLKEKEAEIEAKYQALLEKKKSEPKDPVDNDF